MSAAEKIAGNPLLDKTLINAFIDGVQKTLSTIANTPSTPGKPYVEKEYSTKGEVSGVIGMTAGAMKGTISVTFQKDAILHVIQNMIGESYTDINKDVTDAVGELTNMIYGSAKTTLNELGYAFNMAIPTVITGAHTIQSYHKGATLVIPFTCGGGGFSIEINVEA